MTDILYVLRYWPTLSETFIYREIAELLRRRVQVAVLAIGTREDGQLQDELPAVEVFWPPKNLGVLPLALSRDPATLNARCFLEQYLRKKNVLRALWVGRLARRLGVRRLHAHFLGEPAEWACGAAMSVGLPFSVTVHANGLYRPRPSVGAVLRAADLVVVVAECLRPLIAEYGARATVIRCGIDPRRYSPAPTGGGMAVRPGGPLRVVCVARWVPKKGLEDLVSAVHNCDFPISLRLVADVPPSWSSSNIEVGFLPPSQVPATLAAAHVFALPCRIAPDGDQDTIPVSLLEAMAAGLPVLTTPVGAIAELVDRKVGWLVPAGDVAALTDTLAEIARDPEEGRRRGRAGRERILACRYTVERQVDELLVAWGLA